MRQYARATRSGLGERRKAQRCFPPRAAAQRDGLEDPLITDAICVSNQNACRHPRSGHARHDKRQPPNPAFVCLHIVWRREAAGVFNRRSRWRLHLLRFGLNTTMLVIFIYGLQTLGLAEAYSVSFIAPLLMGPITVLPLGESVQPRHWTAIGPGRRENGPRPESLRRRAQDSTRMRRPCTTRSQPVC